MKRHIKIGTFIVRRGVQFLIGLLHRGIGGSDVGTMQWLQVDLVLSGYIHSRRRLPGDSKALINSSSNCFLWFSDPLFTEKPCSNEKCVPLLFPRFLLCPFCNGAARHRRSTAASVSQSGAARVQSPAVLCSSNSTGTQERQEEGKRAAGRVVLTFRHSWAATLQHCKKVRGQSDSVHAAPDRRMVVRAGGVATAPQKLTCSRVQA